MIKALWWKKFVQTVSYLPHFISMVIVTGMIRELVSTSGPLNQLVAYFGGNKISFRVDRTLTREYGEKGFGVCIDLTADKTANAPALGLFTFKGGEFIQGTLEGLGGLDGLSSGKISSPVAGSKLAVMSYGGVAVFNPYKSFIIREA